MGVFDTIGKKYGDFFKHVAAFQNGGGQPVNPMADATILRTGTMEEKMAALQRMRQGTGGGDTSGKGGGQNASQGIMAALPWAGDRPSAPAGEADWRGMGTFLGRHLVGKGQGIASLPTGRSPVITDPRPTIPNVVPRTAGPGPAVNIRQSSNR